MSEGAYKTMAESLEREVYSLKNQLDVIDDLFSCGLSGNAVALYLYVKRMSTMGNFPKNHASAFLKTDEETAEKAMQELADYGWIRFGIVFDKHSETDGVEFIVPTYPSEGDKGFRE